MKRTYIFIVVLLLSGTALFAQAPDMSFYTEEYNRSDTTPTELLDILKMVQEDGLTGIGDFYQNAIRVFIQRLPNFSAQRYRTEIEQITALLFRGITAEKHKPAAPFVWQLIRYFDIATAPNDGILMYEGIITLGEIGAKEFANYVVAYLETYNERASSNLQVRAQVQRVVRGLVRTLEVLGEPIGVKPVFYTSIGWYDNDIKAEAAASLQRLMDSLGEVIGDIIASFIRDPFNIPSIKLTAWQYLLQTHISDDAKGKVAAVALETSYTFIATSRDSQNDLKMMRMSAIDIMRVTGIKDDQVYAFLERTYREAFDSPNTDFEIIVQVVRTLSINKTDEAIELLTEFLRGLHSRKRSGPWGTVERDIMAMVILSISTTGTQNRSTIQLLTVISRSAVYTEAEQAWARNALNTLNKR